MAGERGRGNVCDPIEPCRAVPSWSPPEQRGIPGEIPVGWPEDFFEFGVDGAESGVRPVVVGIPFPALIDFRTELLGGLFPPGDLRFGLLDVVGEGVDLVDGGGLRLAALAAELGEGPEVVEALPGVVEAVVGPVQLLLGRRERELRLTEGRLTVGWPVLEQRSEFAPFGDKTLDPTGGGLVDGEARVGLSAEGLEDFLLRGALVGHHAGVVDLRQPDDVPGVGGVPGAALPGVAGEALKRGGSEQAP